MPRPPTPFLLIVLILAGLWLSAVAGPMAAHGTPEAGTPGSGTPGAGTPGAGTPGPGTPEATAPATTTPDIPIPDAAAPAVAMVLQDAADRLGVPQDEIRVIRVEHREWPDASLGCPEPGSFYAQVITPGYLIEVASDGMTLEYHTDATGSIITLCD